MIVDAHAHVFLPASEDYPRTADDLAPADRTAPVERLAVAMAGAGVEAAVLVPLDHHDRYVAEVLATDPHRFAAVAVAGDAVLGRTGADPVAALRTRRQTFPFHALRTSWLGEPGRPVHDSPFLPVAEHLAAQGMPLWSYLPPDQLPLLEQLVAAVPDLVVVLNHLGFCPHDMQVDAHGRPWFADPFPPSTVDAVHRLADVDTVYVLFSGQYALSREDPPYRDLDDVVGSLASRYGAERMLWGSDFPWTEHVPGYATLAGLPEAALPQLDAAGLAEVRGGTALRLFPHLAA